MNHDHTFAFEADFVQSLRCVPMAVRLKLDRAGVKLTLRQWSRFTAEDRRDLLARPCESAGDVAAYRERLTGLIALRSGEAPRMLEGGDPAAFVRAPAAPDAVVDLARALGLRPPADEVWRGLADLQRFALVKLSRSNHDNVNFGPAMREFGLA